jgi:hypothetical protein
MSISTTNCAACDLPLPNDDPGAPRMPCPQCGSTRRYALEAIEESMNFRDSHHGKQKRPDLPSDKKLRADFYSRDEFSHKYGKLVRAERTIDKDADLYHERISDIETGEVLHECNEPLSQHVGHGYAKPPKT